MELFSEPETVDMTPAELVRYAKFSLQSMELRAQIERDMFAQEIATLCDAQCYAAVELGDEKALLSYSRAGRFIHKYISRYLYGETFTSFESGKSRRTL